MRGAVTEQTTRVLRTQQRMQCQCIPPEGAAAEARKLAPPPLLRLREARLQSQTAQLCDKTADVV